MIIKPINELMGYNMENGYAIFPPTANFRIWNLEFGNWYLVFKNWDLASG